MVNQAGAQECLIHEGCIDIPYRWTVGVTGSRFLTELRDSKRIWGTRCNVCDLTFVPARKYCPRCLTRPLEWIEVGPKGTVQSFTVVHYADPSVHTIATPFAYALIKLDGASTGMVHILGEVDPEGIASGMRVEAVFAQERTGSILDIGYFRPLRK